MIVALPEIEMGEIWVTARLYQSYRFFFAACMTLSCIALLGSYGFSVLRKVNWNQV